MKRKNKSATLTNAEDCIFVVMYDISETRTRNEVVKFLTQMGCLRIQRSVFMGNLSHAKMEEIIQTLEGIYQSYENEDSYIVIPLRKENMKGMKIFSKIKDLSIILRDKPVLFFG